MLCKTPPGEERRWQHGGAREWSWSWWLVSRSRQPAVGGHGGLCQGTASCGAGLAAAQEVSRAAGTKCGGPAHGDTVI